MNGFISKETIISIVFSSVTLFGTFTYASSTTNQGNNAIKNQSKMLTSGAGCMGCHQGEANAENKFMSKNSNNQDQKEQKLKSTSEISKYKVQQAES